MNSYQENMTSGPERGENFLSLATAKRMLPLVRRIVADILLHQKSLVELQPEQDQLHQDRRNLTWPQRKRRYQVNDDFAKAEEHLQSARQELDTLGVSFLDGETGRVGFPTLVNNRRAFFCWQPGEESLHSWQFAEEAVLRPIPASWLKEIALSRK